MRRLTAITALIAVLLAPLACTDPADPIAIGELCLPESGECPAGAELHRDGPGRNAMDVALHHRGDETDGEQVVQIRITSDDDLSLPDERPTTDDGAQILYQQTFAPGPGETIREHLDGFHLTVASGLNLEIQCLEGDCNHRLDYLHFADSVECIEDAMCPRNMFCEVDYGRCAECHDDDGCDAEQQCLRDTGTCYPGDTTGCQSASDSTGARPVWWIAALVLLALAVARARRRQLAVITTATVAVFVVAMPSPAVADTGASFNAGGGMRILTGETGELTGIGWGVNINQQLRWRRIAVMFELSTNNYPITADGPEGSQLSGYAVTVGPRGFVTLPISLPTFGDQRPFELVGGLDYSHWNVAENRLASTTGLQRYFHAVGPTLGIQWRSGGLAAGMRANYSYIFGWPGEAVSVIFTVGIGH